MTFLKEYVFEIESDSLRPMMGKEVVTIHLKSVNATSLAGCKRFPSSRAAARPSTPDDGRN